MRRGKTPVRSLILLAALALAAASPASAQGTLIWPATMAELVRWAIHEGSVPADSWPAIDEAYFAYRTAFDRMSETDGTAPGLAERWAAGAGKAPADAASLARLADETARRVDRCLAAERRFADQFRIALAGGERDGASAQAMARRWRLARLVSVVKLAGDGRLLSKELPSAQWLGVQGEIGAAVDAAGANEVPAAIVAAERTVRTHFRLDTLEWIPEPPRGPGGTPAWLDAQSALAAENAVAHMAFLRAMRRMREAMVARVPEEQREEVRRALLRGDRDRLDRTYLPFVTLRRLRLDPGVRRAVDAALDEHLGQLAEAIEANAIALDRCVAAGDVEAFEQASNGSFADFQPKLRRFDDTVKALLGPDLVERWNAISGRSATPADFAAWIEPGHADEVASVEPSYQRTLLGRSSPERVARAAVVAASVPSAALVDAIHALGGPANRDAIDAALATHAATWEQRVSPALAALRARAPGLTGVTPRTVPIDEMPQLLRAVRAAWDEIEAVDDALFAAIALVLEDADAAKPGASPAAASERATALAALRLRRVAELVRFDASRSFRWLGEAFPLPSDLPAAVDFAFAESGSPASAAHARRILADLAGPLAQATLTAGRRHDAMYAVCRAIMPDAPPVATSDEQQEHWRANNTALAEVAAGHDCTLASVVEAWVRGRDALLAAWDAALPPDDARALRAAVLRGEHPHLLRGSDLADEALGDLIEQVRADETAPVGMADLLVDVRTQHRRRQDDRLIEFARVAAPWALRSRDAEDWSGMAPEVWMDRPLDLSRHQLRFLDDAVRAIRDAWLVTGEERVRRVPAAQIMLGL